MNPCASPWMSARSRWLVTVFVTLHLVLAAQAPVPAAPRESKIIVYLIYNKGNPAHKTFVDALYKKFNQLGFVDRMKKRGVAWVEAGYQGTGSVAGFLHIAPEHLIYFGVLMADSTERVTREMFRAHIPVASNVDLKVVKREADENAHKFYYEVANLLDTFQNPTLWKRQISLLDPKEERAGGVKLLLAGKDITANTALLPRSPFMRSNIHVVMAPFSPALWKRLGADEATIVPAAGNRSVLTVKKGSRKMVFEVGPGLTDLKTWSVSHAGHAEKRFINPTNLLFAYPEVQGNVIFVPLRLVMHELSLPFDYKTEGFTVTLTPKK